jgi:hypothetical protein
VGYEPISRTVDYTLHVGRQDGAYLARLTVEVRWAANPGVVAVEPAQLYPVLRRRVARLPYEGSIMSSFLTPFSFIWRIPKVQNMPVQNANIAARSLARLDVAVFERPADPRPRVFSVMHLEFSAPFSQKRMVFSIQAL